MDKVLKNIDELKNWIENYLTNSENIENLHKVRTKTRRVLSLIKDDSELYFKLKEIMNRSGKIRDIDIFLSEFFQNLPKEFQNELIDNEVKYNILNQKEYLKNDLIEYLEELNLNVLTIEKNLNKIGSFSINFKIPKLSNKKLHKFRKRVKKVRYNLESHSKNKKLTKKLKKLQDLLGEIHDNYTALKMIKESIGKSNLYKKINKKVKKENKKRYKNAKKLFKEIR